MQPLAYIILRILMGVVAPKVTYEDIMAVIDPFMFRPLRVLINPFKEFALWRPHPLIKWRTMAYTSPSMSLLPLQLASQGQSNSEPFSAFVSCLCIITHDRMYFTVARHGLKLNKAMNFWLWSIRTSIWCVCDTATHYIYNLAFVTVVDYPYFLEVWLTTMNVINVLALTNHRIVVDFRYQKPFKFFFLLAINTEEKAKVKLHLLTVCHFRFLYAVPLSIEGTKILIWHQLTNHKMCIYWSYSKNLKLGMGIWKKQGKDLSEKRKLYGNTCTWILFCWSHWQYQ